MKPVDDKLVIAFDLGSKLALIHPLTLRFLVKLSIGNGFVNTLKFNSFLVFSTNT
jgi:hypothetical protein